MARPRPSLSESLRRMDERGYGDIAIQFREMFDEHRLAALVKDLRPRIRMTTAYKIANEVRAMLNYR